MEHTQRASKMEILIQTRIWIRIHIQIEIQIAQGSRQRRRELSNSRGACRRRLSAGAHQDEASASLSAMVGF